MNDTVLDLGSDVGIRNRWFTRESYAHPAKCHLALLQFIIDRFTQPGDTIADCMAGSGSLLLAAAQQRNVILRECEPRFLAMCHANAAQVLERAGWFAGHVNIGNGDAREPWDFTADHIIMSPPYGCDAQHHHARHTEQIPARLEQRGYDRLHIGKRWRTVTPHRGAGAALIFSYGDHPAQIGGFRGARYWQAMEPVYRNAYTALHGGVLVVIIKDHIRNGQRVLVADQTVALCERIGFVLQERHARRVWPLSLWQRRRKEQGKPIIEEEDVLMFKKAGAP